MGLDGLCTCKIYSISVCYLLTSSIYHVLFASSVQHISSSLLPLYFNCLMNCSPNLVEQAMLFLSFDDDRIEAFKSQFYEAAKQYGEKNISFLIGDVTDAQGALQVIFNL